MSTAASKVYIIILNWNNWPDTLECLESVFRCDYPAYQVIVCDNGSEDGSIEQIKDWAEGRLDVFAPPDALLRSRSHPPVEKPIPYTEYSRDEVEQGQSTTRSEPLILIKNGANLGFAGGNNVGLRYALARDDFEYVWLLNNDTVINPDTLKHMIYRIQEKPNAGMCGSTLLYYEGCGKVQTLGGGRYNKWLGLPFHIGWLRPSDGHFEPESIERKMDYVVGASMLVTRKYLHQVGLMTDDYFLYFEDLDWALRGRKMFSLAYAPQSIVYHKEGATIGGSSLYLGQKSATCDYYYIRNRLLITRRFFPAAALSVRMALLPSIINRIRRRQWDRIGMILKLGCSR